MRCMKQTEDIDIYDGDIDELNFNFNNDLPNFCPNISFLKIEIMNPPKSIQAISRKIF